MRSFPALLAVCALVTAGVPVSGQVSAPARPSLVLVITVDQLRPDYLEAYAGQFTGGFARLLRGGAVFPNGFQDHGITETAPGHASILSGRFPRSTGIVGNTAGVEDAEAPLIGARGPGASPYRFRGTTLADWMRFHDPRSRSLSVSRKDRAAILPLGRAKGEAYWYASSGTFTTSRWYADTLPAWVQRFNARRAPHQYAGRTWDLLLDPSSYAEPDTVLVEARGADVVFPHAIPADTARATAVLPNYPMMDSLTLHLALEGVQARELGATGDRTDLLAISLSTTDAVGHNYGPDSRELHDQVLRLDRYLGSFLDSLYRLRDSSRVTIALTSDHGVAPFPEPEVASRYRLSPGGYAELRPIAEAIYRGLIAAGVDSSAFRWEMETLYLLPEPFKRAGVNRDSVARLYAAAASRVEGVLRADAWEDLRKRDPRKDTYARRWLQMFPPDLPVAAVVTLRPFWYWAGAVQAAHGSPHDYDARVPVIFAGAGVRPGRHAEVVRVVDIAPTLAELIGVTPMEALDGVPVRRAMR
jgi:predicted AlkP superfamily pyrophosphatase or phosphodiesterase